MTAQHYIKMKKGQIHMTETIVVLLIFFIIMFFGIYLYYNYTFKNIKESAYDVQERQAQAQLQIISAMPEFSCTDFSCIDVLKLKGFQQTYTNNQDYYQNIFGYKTIIIQQIYPDKETYQIYNNPKPNYQTKLDSAIPISLYYPLEDMYKLGKIILTQYE